MLDQPGAVALDLLDKNDTAVTSRHPLAIDGDLRRWCTLDDIASMCADFLGIFRGQRDHSLLERSFFVRNLVLLVGVRGFLERVRAVRDVLLESWRTSRGCVDCGEGSSLCE
jgi:hypothetical protein